MRKSNRLSMLIMLSIMAFGGFISYSGIQQNSAKAEIIPIHREVAVLKPIEVPTINVDLNSNKVAVEGTPTATVTINQPERTIVKWKTKIVEKLVVQHPTVDLVKYSKPVFSIPQ